MIEYFNNLYENIRHYILCLFYNSNHDYIYEIKEGKIISRKLIYYY